MLSLTCGTKLSWAETYSPYNHQEMQVWEDYHQLYLCDSTNWLPFLSKLCHKIWPQIGDMSPHKLVENVILSDLKCGISQHAANNRKCENQNWGTEGNDRKIGSDIMLQVKHISVLNRVSFMISLPNIKGGG